MDDIYENSDEYNPNKRRKILFVFDNMVADMLNSTKRNLIIKELFIKSNSAHYFITLI